MKFIMSNQERRGAGFQAARKRRRNTLDNGNKENFGRIIKHSQSFQESNSFLHATSSSPTILPKPVLPSTCPEVSIGESTFNKENFNTQIHISEFRKNQTKKQSCTESTPHTIKYIQNQFQQSCSTTGYLPKEEYTCSKAQQNDGNRTSESLECRQDKSIARAVLSLRQSRGSRQYTPYPNRRPPLEFRGRERNRLVFINKKLDNS